MPSPAEESASSFSIVVPKWQASLLPDLACFLTIVCLLYCFFFYNAPSQLFRDSDTGWHIRNGETILQLHRLPTVDPYSFSKGDERWYSWEWAADAAMGYVHQIDGLRGVVLLYLILISSCMFLWVRLHWAVGGNFLFVCLFAAPMLSTTNLHWLARPHLFSWVFILGALLCLEQAPRAFRPWHVPAIVVATALWTNLHASFPLAIVLPVLYCFSYSVGALLFDVNAEEHLAKARWCLLAAPLAMLATLLNPLGIGVHVHIAAYLSNTQLLARIAEFQSFNFHSEGAWQIVAGVIIAMAGAVAAFSTARLGSCLLILILTAGALRSARGLPLLALVALPLANGALTAWLRRLDGLRPAVRNSIDSALDYFSRLRLIDRQLFGHWWFAVGLALCWVVLHAPAQVAQTGFPKDQFPVEAAREIAKLPPDARILAPDKYGGYLIYRFKGERKVYFDGRSDFYGIEFMKEYIRLVEARPGWPQILENYGFTHALLPKEYSLIPALERLGWKKLHEDSVCVILSRNF